VSGPALALACYDVRVRIVDHTASDVRTRLRALLPPEAVVGGTDDAAPDVTYEIRPCAPAGAGSAPGWEILRDGQARHRAGTVEAVVGWLRSDLDHQVATHAHDFLFVHAGVVGWRGRAILVPGRSMTGKTTLVAALVRAGACYYSDEYAVLDERGLVHPYARPLRLRAGARPDGAAAVEEAPEAPVSREPLPAALIVSTTYREGAPWAPSVVTGARAVIPLIDNTVLAATAPARTVRLAAALAPGVVTLQGERSDAAQVAPSILQLVDELLDGRRWTGPARRGTIRAWGSAYDAPVSGQPSSAGSPDARRYPARYLRVEHFLDPAEHARLLEYTGTHEAEFLPGQVFYPGAAEGGVVDPEVRRARDNKALGPIWDLFETRLQRLLPEVRRTLGIPWFPVSAIECRVVAHANGDFFGVHVDSGKGPGAGRRVTAVYYFHRTPKRFSGGALRLYDAVLRNGRIEPASTYTELEPLDNSVVFFPSQLFHEVCPVRAESPDFRDSRFTVNVWFRTTLPAIEPETTAANASGLPRESESAR
jgi:predicted 2-oxoglutarate/Fe(II)-dependent dioxygenase YbiX